MVCENWSVEGCVWEELSRCLILCCSDTGVHDRDGRRVFLFLAGRFAVSSIPPSQLLLLIIRLLDEASASPFTVVYAHTACGNFFVLCSFFSRHLTPSSPFQACPICPLPKSQRIFTILSRARKSPAFPALFFCICLRRQRLYARACALLAVYAAANFYGPVLYLRAHHD